MELVLPDKKYKDSYLEALDDGFNAKYLGSQSPMDAEDIAEIKNDFEGFLTQQVLRPADLTPKQQADGKYYAGVPRVLYWLIDNGKFIGAFVLRTELNDFLKYIRGNVGYGISPQYRRKGYATQGLSLLIEKARRLGMQKLLIAAMEENIGSWKAIEKNGGVLENIITLPWENSGQRYKRYWIDID